MTRPGIELRSPGPLANTLTARPMSGKENLGKIFRFIKNIFHMSNLYTKVLLMYISRDYDLKISLIISIHNLEKFVS